MKNELDSLFRDAERLRPPPDLWRRIAARSPLAPSAAQAGWREVRYLRAAAAALTAGLLAWAALGLLHGRSGEPVREASAAPALSERAEAEPQLIDPELLGWQADLGSYDLVADEAEEAL